MHFCRILFICFVWIGFALHMSDNFEVKQSDMDESVILGEIITNFLIKYFSDEKIFISIVLAPSNMNQYNFQGDLFVELFDDPTLTEFAASILDRLDNEVRDHRNAFNLIFVDDSKIFS